MFRRRNDKRSAASPRVYRRTKQQQQQQQQQQQRAQQQQQQEEEHERPPVEECRELSAPPSAPPWAPPMDNDVDNDALTATARADARRGSRKAPDPEQGCNGGGQGRDEEECRAPARRLWLTDQAYSDRRRGGQGLPSALLCEVLRFLASPLGFGCASKASLRASRSDQIWLGRGAATFGCVVDARRRSVDASLRRAAEALRRVRERQAAARERMGEIAKKLDLELRTIRARRLELKQHRDAGPALALRRDRLYGRRGAFELVRRTVAPQHHVYFDGVCARELAQREAALREGVREHERTIAELALSQAEAAAKEDGAIELARGATTLRALRDRLQAARPPPTPAPPRESSSLKRPRKKRPAAL